MSAFIYRPLIGLAPRLLAAVIIVNALGATGRAATDAAAPDVWRIHEWGTFTVLQDDDGNALGGINVDDEPAPPFVHQISPELLGWPVAIGGLGPMLNKGLPERYPLVTMRLETPVIYFHPPQNQAGPRTVDVSVKFRGGWLTQFYPAPTKADAPGLDPKAVADSGAMTRDTVGSVEWRGLKVGGAGAGPNTDEHVWTTPRKVEAANVTIRGEKAFNPQGREESEKFLFYRGLANLESPVQTQTDPKTGAVQIRVRPERKGNEETLSAIGPLWFVHVRPDGTAAFEDFECVFSRKFGPLDAAPFPKAKYSAKNLDRLRADMRSSLASSGLSPDEAAAMIATWDTSYFRSPGLRLFFIVPRAWTNKYLPLSINLDADVQRVFVGRIELISPEQRAGLAKLAAAEPSDPSWVFKITKHRDEFLAGRSDFGDLGVPIPADYRAYLGLGRFRNALVVNEQRRHPSPNLKKFIESYDLSPYEVKK